MDLEIPTPRIHPNLFGPGSIRYHDHRIVLEKLHNELIDMIMEYLDAKELHPFLFLRQLNPAATREIYLNLNIVVWNPKIVRANFEKDLERYNANVAVNFRKKMQRIALLVDTADEAEYLFEHTTTLSMKLSDMDPMVVTRLCLSIRPRLSHDPWDSW